MPTYKDTDIITARDVAAKLALVGCGHFCTVPVKDIQRICNGIGAEWMPDVMRSLLDKRFYVLRIAAMVHDVNYYYGTGTESDFHEANHNLYVNGCKLAKDAYPWWHVGRYLVMHDARKLAGMCELFGKKAYNEAIADRMAHGGN